MRRLHTPPSGRARRRRLPAFGLSASQSAFVNGHTRCVLDALLVQDQFDLRDQFGKV